MTIEITAENFENEVLNSDKPVLIDFWAAWCGPCRMLSPVVDEIAEENDSVKVGKVNVDEQLELAAQFGIPEAFQVVSVPDGLREMDRMLCDMIRTAASGKIGKDKYRISYRDLRRWGYHSLVRRYYQSIR